MQGKCPGENVQGGIYLCPDNTDTKCQKMQKCNVPKVSMGLIRGTKGGGKFEKTMNKYRCDNVFGWSKFFFGVLPMVAHRRGGKF